MLINKEIHDSSIAMGKELTTIIENNDNCHLEMHIEYNGNIWLHTKNYETELRYIPFVNNLIVSRVQFQNKRCGCMTKCMEKIIEYAEELKVNMITIQSVMTEEMENWCRKNHFIPKEGATMLLEGVTVGDYVFEIG